MKREHSDLWVSFAASALSGSAGAYEAPADGAVKLVEHAGRLADLMLTEWLERFEPDEKAPDEKAVGKAVGYPAPGPWPQKFPEKAKILCVCGEWSLCPAQTETLTCTRCGKTYKFIVPAEPAGASNKPALSQFEKLVQVIKVEAMGSPWFYQVVVDDPVCAVVVAEADTEAFAKRSQENIRAVICRVACLARRQALSDADDVLEDTWHERKDMPDTRLEMMEEASRRLRALIESESGEGEEGEEGDDRG